MSAPILPGISLELHRHHVALGLDDGRPRRLVAAEPADLLRAVERRAVEGGDVVVLAARVDLQLEVVKSAMCKRMQRREKGSHSL